MTPVDSEPGPAADSTPATQVELSFAEGIALHRQQRLAEAAVLFASVVHRDPLHVGAWRMRGLTALQSGHTEAAVAWLGKAGELDPGSADTHCYLGHGLRILGRYEESVGCHDRALALNPRLAGAWFDRGCGLRALKRQQQALLSFERALAHRPGFVEALINRGNVLADLNRMDEALASFDAAIGCATPHAAAHANRGWILMQLNRPAEALESYQAAIALGNAGPEVHNNRGVALMQLERAEEALAAFEHAIALDAAYAEAHHNSGVALRTLQRTEEALAAHERALAQRPGYAAAYAHRARALLDLNRPEEALASAERALELGPGQPQIQLDRVAALRKLQRLEDALAGVQTALASRPDDPDLLCALGQLLLDLKRFDAAFALFDRPDLRAAYPAMAYNNRAVALRGLGRTEEALQDLDRSLEIGPDNPEILLNKGNVLRDLHLPEAAIDCYDHALELRPGYAEVHNSRGVALMTLNRFAEAMADYDQAIAAVPEYADAHWNRGLLALRHGDFARGWEGYEWRKRRDQPVAHRRYGNKLWLGQDDIAGASVFLHWEQGLGDTILFSRYALTLEARGARVVLQVQEPLRCLMDGMSPGIRVLGGNELPQSFDRHCPLGSLPLACATRTDTIPAPVPYLHTPEATLRAWRDRLGPARRPRIGVVWRGSVSQANDARPMPLALWRPLFDLPAEWFALQKLVTAEDAEVLRSHGVQVFADERPDFAITAALAELMDLVLSVDTSVAHMAGAMGRPVWILLPYNADWRWMLDRTDSPWYPTARLFRQRSIADWRPIAADVLSAARHWLQG